ncbi:hypothetical protein RIF29_38034 [Crotalaria pallida]|uniref:Uncharacterized protein n=1 Tax=Crotalaria pallida TaxID=3830 RepID=A0AAN9HRY7_CROPI
MLRSNSQLDLRKVVEARFASHYVLIEILLDCKDALITTVVRDAWREIQGMPPATMDAATMDAIEWRSTYRSQTSELPEVAKKVDMQITEVRDLAGQEIEVKKHLDSSSKEAIERSKGQSSSAFCCVCYPRTNQEEREAPCT